MVMVTVAVFTTHTADLLDVNDDVQNPLVLNSYPWLHGKGAVMGFFGFLPAVGDVILVALGFMRANAPVVMVWMTAGKFLRYLLIGFGTNWVAGIF